MRTRVRDRREDQTVVRNPSIADGDPAGDTLVAARDEARDLVAAGDETIRRALSGDSEGFLRHVRQDGGQ